MILLYHIFWWLSRKFRKKYLKIRQITGTGFVHFVQRKRR
nr:MAG TPA: hypothetical protein [Caudoviricetes sp.]